jgi:hypothetical protein
VPSNLYSSGKSGHTTSSFTGLPCPINSFYVTAKLILLATQYICMSFFLATQYMHVLYFAIVFT